MSQINEIQNAILELEGGAYQKLLDAYLYKKYNYQNIQTLGVQAGTNKVTVGIPDSYVDHGNGKYTLIMYGTVQQAPYSKDRKSTRLNSSHVDISYAVFCLIKTNDH